MDAFIFDLPQKNGLAQGIKEKFIRIFVAFTENFNFNANEPF